MRTRWIILCLAGLAACSQGDPGAVDESGGFTPSGRPSILLITLDTTRADHLEPYGANEWQLNPVMNGGTTLGGGAAVNFMDICCKRGRYTRAGVELV